MQAKIDHAWLLQRGYTGAQAARRLNLSRQHVNKCLSGDRISKKVEAALLSLPKRALVLRERAAH